MNAKTLLIVSLIVGSLTLVACGGDSSGGDSERDPSLAASGPTGAGMATELSDEEIRCLEDQGVTLPENPEDSPQGVPGGAPPQGTGSEPEEMRAAMTECGIEMPDPPEGAPSGEPPSGEAPPVETQGT